MQTMTCPTLQRNCEHRRWQVPSPGRKEQ